MTDAEVEELRELAEHRLQKVRAKEEEIERLRERIAELEAKIRRDDRARQRRTRVRTLDDDERVPVEELLVGETVQAVKAGPKGEVIQNEGGWTVARYKPEPGGTCTYKHGQDKLFRVRG